MGVITASVRCVTANPLVTRRLGLCDGAIFWSFIAGLAWVPFWYGGNDLIAWGINALIFPGLAAGYAVSLLVRGKSHPVGIASLAAPAALFSAVVLGIAVQVVCWPSPAPRDPIWSLAAEALSRPLDGSITVNRDLTNLALVRLITAGAVFWIAVQLCRDAVRADALIRSVAIIACGYAAYGLFALSTADYAPGSGPNPERFLASTFINRNCFATYGGIGLVAIAGVAIELYRTTHGGGRRLQPAALVEWLGKGGAAPLAGGFLIAVAVLLTGSRGGVTAAGIGLIALALPLRPRSGAGRSGRGKYPVIAGLFAVAVAMAMLIVFGDAFFNSVAERGIIDADRLSIYLLTLRSILDAPFLGHGYGTFVDVFPLYRDRSLGVQGAWEQAHNTYLEVFQGLGLVFGSLLVICVLLLVLRCIKGSRTRKEHSVVPRVAASAAVLVGSHALVDFSLQMQAVAITLMALLGAGVAQSASSRLVLED